MRVLTSTGVILALALQAAACGEPCGLSGSQCDLIDCGFDKLTCQKYDTPNDALRMSYQRQLESGGFDYTAVMIVDLAGLTTAEGLTVDGQGFVDRVTFYRVGTEEQWPDFEEGQLEITAGGDQVDQALKGKASFRFVNGYFATACFDCTLESVDVQ